MEEVESSVLKENDSFVKALFGAIRHGMDSLEHAPGLIKKIITNNRWQRRMVEGRGWQIVEFNTFEEFVTTKTPDGLGTSVQRIKDACQHDDDAIKLIDGVLQRPAGAPVGNVNAVKDKETIVDNINNCIERPTGTSRAAGLRRLRKDRPDLYNEVGKTKTVNQAMVEAGFRVTPIQLNPTDPYKAAKTILNAIESGKIDMGYITMLITILAEKISE